MAFILSTVKGRDDPILKMWFAVSKFGYAVSQIFAKINTNGIIIERSWILIFKCKLFARTWRLNVTAKRYAKHKMQQCYTFERIARISAFIFPYTYITGTSIRFDDSFRNQTLGRDTSASETSRLEFRLLYSLNRNSGAGRHVLLKSERVGAHHEKKRLRAHRTSTSVHELSNVAHLPLPRGRLECRSFVPFMRY